MQKMVNTIMQSAALPPPLCKRKEIVIQIPLLFAWNLFIVKMRGSAV